MRVLAGDLRPDTGDVRRTGRVGFLRQVTEARLWEDEDDPRSAATSG